MEDRLVDFIDVEELVHLFKKRFWIVIVIAAMTTALGVYKVSKLEPTYIATSKIFIGEGKELVQIYSEQELEYYSKFVSIFTEIARIDGFLDETLKKNKIDKSSVEVASALQFSSSANIPIFNITYRSITDEKIEETLDAVCGELISKVKEIMKNTDPVVLSPAVATTIYPNKKKLPIMMAAVGIILGIGLILVLDYFDDRIISKKSLEKLIDIPVIGEIPSHERKFKKEEKNVRSKSNADINVSGSI